MGIFRLESLDAAFVSEKNETGKWIQGDLVHYFDRFVIREFGDYWVISETVGQYTGLTDKKGKKIFEGDIVNVNTNKDTLCHRYEGRNLVIRFDEYHRFVASGRLEYPLCNHYEWEVIGNIHDNPELLKGGAE